MITEDNQSELGSQLGREISLQEKIEMRFLEFSKSKEFLYCPTQKGKRI